jgi:hypothetical protein
MNENSLETGKKVFSQPYSGSMFRSENNYTWTAEQTQDIKFTLYQAQFNTAVNANLNLTMSANNISVPCTKMQTIAGSSYAFLKLENKHGLDINSKLALACDEESTYNGVSGALMNGVFSVFNVPTEYTVGIVIPTASFTKTGTVETGGRVKDIQVTAGGSGYSSASPPTVVITGLGTGATAVPVISNGVITDVKVTNPGTGYTTVPTITFNNGVGGTGSGAIAIALTDEKFVITPNAVYHEMNPSIINAIPSDTSISGTLTTTLAAFEGGTVVNYSSGKTYPIDINKVNYFDNSLLLASRYNESNNMSNNPSAVMNLVLSSSNPNLSPVIELDNNSVKFNNNRINNQRTEEVLTSTRQFGQVISVNLLSGGTGYTNGVGTVTAEIYGTGNGATIGPITVSGGVIQGPLTVTAPGSGYINAPKIRFIGTNTTPASATVAINDYNSETAVKNGTATARYISKKQTIATVSTGVNVYTTAFSNIDSSFEVYIRSSLSSSGVDHDLQPWVLLSCDITRNKSETVNDYKEYTFYKTGLPQYDIFSLKFVLRSKTPWQPPVIKDYRAIALAA